MKNDGACYCGYRNQHRQDESYFLEPLQQAAPTGRTFAEDLLHRFEHEWQGDMGIALPAMCEETFS